jgi:hypothetical protein
MQPLKLSVNIDIDYSILKGTNHFTVVKYSKLFWRNACIFNSWNLECLLEHEDFLDLEFRIASFLTNAAWRHSPSYYGRWITVPLPEETKALLPVGVS